MTIDLKLRDHPNPLHDKYIDCLRFKGLTLCLSDDTYFHLKHFAFRSERNFSLELIRDSNGKIELKMVEGKDQSLDNETEYFDGRLKGISISAALDLKLSGKQFFYLFAGRYLCRQVINETDWTQMCEIEDISDWINCPLFPAPKDEGSSKIWLIAMIVAIIVIVVMVIVPVFFVHRSGSKPNDSIEPKPIS